jgi:CHASE3 domain sensor protein
MQKLTRELTECEKARLTLFILLVMVVIVILQVATWVF